MSVPPRIRLEDSFTPLLRDTGSLVGHADPDGSFHERPIDRDRRVRRRVLDCVFDEVLENLAKPRWIGKGMERDPRQHIEVVLADDRLDRCGDLVDRCVDVRRDDGGRDVGDDADGRQDRVDEAVEPFDLLERRRDPFRRPPRAVRARVGDRIRFSMTNRSDEPVPGVRLLFHSKSAVRHGARWVALWKVFEIVE